VGIFCVCASAYTCTIACKSGSVLVLSVLSYFVCLSLKYLGNGCTDLRHIHWGDMFGPSVGEFEGQGQRSRSPWTKNARGNTITPRQRRNGTRSLQMTSRSSGRHHSVASRGMISTACVRFMCIKTSLVYFLLFRCSNCSRFMQTVADSIHIVLREQTRQFLRVDVGDVNYALIGYCKALSRPRLA